MVSFVRESLDHSFVGRKSRGELQFFKFAEMDIYHCLRDGVIEHVPDVDRAQRSEWYRLHADHLVLDDGNEKWEPPLDRLVGVFLIFGTRNLFGDIRDG